MSLSQGYAFGSRTARSTDTALDTSKRAISHGSLLKRSTADEASVPADSRRSVSAAALSRGKAGTLNSYCT